MRLSIAALRTCAFAKRKQNNKAQVLFAHIQPCILALEMALRTCAFAKHKQNNKAQVPFAHIQPTCLRWK
jgi:hypothetical protein